MYKCSKNNLYYQLLYMYHIKQISHMTHIYSDTLILKYHMYLFIQ